MDKLKLFGFNNLTKSLGFNFYIIQNLEDEKEKLEFIKRLNDKYSAENLSRLAVEVSSKIDAVVLNVSKQDYDPTGASAVALFADENVDDGIFVHLDKSHLTVHTYPDRHPNSDIVSFRVDIDVATCGTISPLKILDFLLEYFDSDIVVLDYKVRGFTRLESGEKIFLDQEINSIKDFIKGDILDKYNIKELAILQARTFYTVMLKKEVGLDELVVRELEEIWLS